MRLRTFIGYLLLALISSLSFTCTVVLIQDQAAYSKARSTFKSLGLIREQENPPLPEYEEFLKFISNDRFTVYPVCEYQTSYRKDKINIVLRHDLDYDKGYEMAELEQEYGIRSTYYLRLHSDRYAISEVIPFYQELEAKGYEIGYHYEVVDLFPFNNDTAKKVFELELEYLRRYFNVRSASPHGPPFGGYSYQFEQWTDLSDYNLISAYKIPISTYLSDWSQPFWEKELRYFIEELEKLKAGDVVEVLIHPCHWKSS